MTDQQRQMQIGDACRKVADARWEKPRAQLMAAEDFVAVLRRKLRGAG
ncbi:hypothetical protein [Streptomyces sp. PR69]|nr:hypothetical protein [Streptomyces sp. PR69]